MTTLIAFFAAALPLYVVRFPIGPYPTTLLEVLWAALVATLVAARGGVGGLRLPRLDPGRLRPWLWPCGLLALSGIIGVVVSPDTRAALGLFKAYLIEPLLFFGLVMAVADDRLRPRLTQALALSGCVVAVVAVLQPLVAPQTLWEGVRATAFYPFPNAVGLFLAPILVLVAGMKSAGRTTWLRVAAVVLMFGALVAAQSEGAVIGAASGLLALLWLQPKTRMVAVAIVLLGGVGLAFAPAPLRSAIQEKLLLRDWSGTVRRITWGETLTMLRDRPLTGAGLAGYPVAMRGYHEATAIEIFQYPHQIALNVWSELGLLGLAAFVWILGTFFRLASRAESRRERQAAIAAMVALLVHGLVDVPYFKNDLAFLFWIIVALGAGGALPKAGNRLP